jgi:hypothetical protein
MGMIRKTISIGTLGTVSFRSKKEKLERATRSRHEAEVALEEEHGAREVAETRVGRAEKRLKRARAEAERNAHELAKVKRKAKRRSRSRRRTGIGDLLASSEPIVRDGADAVRSATTDTVKRSRKSGRRARKAATKAAVATKDAVTPHVEKLATKVRESIDS